MRQLLKSSCALVLVFGIGTSGCTRLLFPKVDLKDVPQTDYEVIRYTSGAKSPAIILDDPNDDVLLTFKDKPRTKKEGLNAPQRYLKKFLGDPKAYRLQDKETGDILGYLLISPHLEWLVRYDKKGGTVGISIEDPLTWGGNGGD